MVAESKSEPDYHAIDIESIEQKELRTVGAEHLLLHFASHLGLEKTLRQLGLTEKECALALATIIGRAVFPASERATHTWLQTRSGLGELLDFDFSKTSLNQLYTISDVLLTHKEPLESHLEAAQQEFHGYRSTMVLYDITNTYMEGQAKKNPKAKHGVSKEKRTDCPLVTLGLVINEYGFATRSSILAGNIAEPLTLKDAIEALYSSQDLFKPTIVLDAGIATEENLKWLRDQGFAYVVCARQNPPSEELAGTLTSVGNEEKTQVKVAFVKTEGIDEKWLYCESEAKEATASQMMNMFQKRFEEDLNKLRDGIQKPKGRKQLSKILERVGRLKEKHRRISSAYEITVKPSEDGQIATAIHWTVNTEKLEQKLNGYYYLRTYLLNNTPEELWSLYNSLRKVEDAFRFMKSSLGMRPIYHQKEGRVDAHLWITLLAYHLIQACLYQLQQAGLSYNWETIRNRMSGRVRVTMQAKTEKGTTLHHRSTTKAESNQREIYMALKMTPQILKTKKIFI